MSLSVLRLIRQCAEFRPMAERVSVRHGTRGMYVLYKFRRKLAKYDVVYVGMAAKENASVRSRLDRHALSERKRDLWTHFSVYEVWPNISEQEVAELEGLFRHIYRKDHRANKLNRQKGYQKLRAIRNNDLSAWKSARAASA